MSVDQDPDEITQQFINNAVTDMIFRGDSTAFETVLEGIRHGRVSVTVNDEGLTVVAKTEVCGTCGCPMTKHSPTGCVMPGHGWCLFAPPPRRGFKDFVDPFPHLDDLELEARIGRLEEVVMDGREAELELMAARRAKAWRRAGRP